MHLDEHPLRIDTHAGTERIVALLFRAPCLSTCLRRALLASPFSPLFFMFPSSSAFFCLPFFHSVFVRQRFVFRLSCRRHYRHYRRRVFTGDKYYNGYRSRSRSRIDELRETGQLFLRRELFRYFR